MPMPEFSVNGKKKYQAEDKRKTIFMTLSDYTELLDYPASDILYTALRVIAKKKGASVSFLRGISDRELYKEIESALRTELTD